MPRRQLTNEQREQSRKRRLERDRERQRRRRLDPQLRAIERGRNTVAKRLSRAKGLLEEKYMLDIEEQNELKKEREKERQRKRRMDPEFRAKERVRNRTLKRISRQKNYYIQKIVNCECCGEPMESDHVCFSNILSVELHEVDVGNSTHKKTKHDTDNS